MKRSVLVRLIVIGIVVSHPGSLALADAAPPQPPPGTSLEPGESLTMVQMVREDVLLTITEEGAYVQAIFEFLNQGTATESFDVRFPLGADDGWGCVQLVSDFAAWVNGEAAEVSIHGEAEPGCGRRAPWAYWFVAFAPGELVEIGVAYKVVPYLYAGAFGDYLYVLHTGTGWYGPIGEGTVTYRLPYEVSDYNAVVDPESWAAPRPAGYKVTGTDIIWHFTALEPTLDDDVRAKILDPSAWRRYQAALAEVVENPDSLDAHLRLARAINEIVREPHHGTVHDFARCPEMAETGVASYRRALELAPNNVEIHVEYLDLLVGLWLTTRSDEPPEDFVPTLEHALGLDPENARLLEIQYVYESWHSTPVLLETPHPPSTRRPTAAPSKTQTMQSSPTLTPVVATEEMVVDPTATTTVSPGGGAAGPGVIGLALVVIGGAMLWLRSRRA